MAFEVCNVFSCKFSWVITCIHCVLFGRKSESIPTHWVKNVVALSAFETAKNISRSVSFWMSYVQTSSRWVREHIQRIKIWFISVCSCFKRMINSPIGLPFFLNFFMIISCHVILHVLSVGYYYTTKRIKKKGEITRDFMPVFS